MASGTAIYSDAEQYISLLRETESLGVADLFSREGWYLVCDAPVADYYFKQKVAPDRILQLVEGGAFLSDEIRLPETPPNVVIVATRRSEHAVLGVLRKRRVRAIGMISQVLPRLAAGAPARIAEADLRGQPRPARQVAILGESQLFGKELLRAFQTGSMPSAGAHIDRGHIALSEHRNISDFELARWWNLLVRSQSTNGTFMTWIDWPVFAQLRRFLTKNELAWLDGKLSKFKFIRINSPDVSVTATYEFLASRVSRELAPTPQSILASRDALSTVDAQACNSENAIGSDRSLADIPGCSNADRRR